MPMPTKPKGEKYKPTSITLPPDTIARIKARARPGQSVSAMLKDVIEEWLDRTEPEPTRRKRQA